jgi:hypothetical protein
MTLRRKWPTPPPRRHATHSDAQHEARNDLRVRGGAWRGREGGGRGWPGTLKRPGRLPTSRSNTAAAARRCPRECKLCAVIARDPALHGRRAHVAGVVAIVAEAGDANAPGVPQLEQHQAKQQGVDDLLAGALPEAVPGLVQPWFGVVAVVAGVVVRVSDEGGVMLGGMHAWLQQPRVRMVATTGLQRPASTPAAPQGNSASRSPTPATRSTGARRNSPPPSRRTHFLCICMSARTLTPHSR